MSSSPSLSPHVKQQALPAAAARAKAKAREGKGEAAEAVEALFRGRGEVSPFFFFAEEREKERGKPQKGGRRHKTREREIKEEVAFGSVVWLCV